MELGELVNTRSELETKRRELEDQLKQTKKAISLLDFILLEKFTQTGIQNVKSKDFTCYVENKVWASLLFDTDIGVVHRDAQMNKLKNTSFGYLVHDGYNVNQLSAAVRELETDLEGLPVLPDELKELVKVSSDTKIKLRKV